MADIGKRIKPECVLLDLEAADKVSVLKDLVGALKSAYGISDSEALLKDILDREELSTTCVGMGCAIPHCHSSQLDHTIISAARLTEPLDMDAPDGEAVSLVFLIAGPPARAAFHLKLLSKLARILHDEALLKALKSAEGTEAFLELLGREAS